MPKPSKYYGLEIQSDGRIRLLQSEACRELRRAALAGRYSDPFKLEAAIRNEECNAFWRLTDEQRIALAIASSVDLSAIPTRAVKNT